MRNWACKLHMCEHKASWSSRDMVIYLPLTAFQTQIQSFSHFFTYFTCISSFVQHRVLLHHEPAPFEFRHVRQSDFHAIYIHSRKHIGHQSHLASNWIRSPPFPGWFFHPIHSSAALGFAGFAVLRADVRWDQVRFLNHLLRPHEFQQLPLATGP